LASLATWFFWAAPNDGANNTTPNKGENTTPNKGLTFAEIRAVALGELSLHPFELDYYTPLDFMQKLHGFRELKKQETREMWTAMRWQTHKLLQPHLKRGSRLNERDLIRFPWEQNSSDAASLHEFVTKNKAEFDKLPKVTRISKDGKKLSIQEAMKIKA
jgi:hypothetical protein